MDDLLEDVFDEEHPLPDGEPEASESPGQPEPAGDQQPEEQPPVAAKASNDDVAAETADTSSTDPQPQSVQEAMEIIAGMKKALAASRGDTREATKRERELQLQLARLEGAQQAQLQFRQTPQQSQPQQQDPPDLLGMVIDNPKGFEDYILQRAEELTTSRVSSAEARFYNLSAAQAQYRHEDYKEAENAFELAARSNPMLIEAARQQADPGEFVYQVGKRQLGGDPHDKISQLEAQIAQLKSAGVQQQQPQSAPSINDESLIHARGTGVAAKPAGTVNPNATLNGLFSE